MTQARCLLRMTGLVGVFALCISCTAYSARTSARLLAPNYDPERTAWGTPDIQGIWDFRTLTPLERPPELARKSVLTPEEAREFRDNKLQQLDVDNRAAEASRQRQ